MRLHVCAVGRLRAGPEKALADDYLSRIDRSGRALALGPVQVHEVEDRHNGGPDAETELLARVIPAGAVLCVLDERGETMSSPEFAQYLARCRDAGHMDAAFAIGGADGHGAALRSRAAVQLSFGRMVWPHLLVRVMLAEQLYRSVSILAGAPYHRT